MNRIITTVGVLFALLLLVMACEAPPTDDEPAEESGEAEVSEDGPAGIDHGGIDSFSDDPALIEKGEELYSAKGCAACHQMDRDTPTGPALGEVANKRTAPWLARQIMHPNEMQQQDPTTQEIQADFPAPMTNLGVTAEEAEAIIAYLAAEAN